MKKNVLQFIGSFHQGGSERQAVQLAKLLKAEDKCNVFVATLNKEGTLLSEIESAGFDNISEFRLKSFYDLNFLKQVKKCSKFLKTEEIDVVQTHDFYTNIFGVLAARLAGVRVKIASKRETEGMRTDLQKRIEKQIFKIADGIVANSESVKSYLLDQGVKGEKIEVIYNGLDFGRLSLNETSRQKICESFGLPVDEKIKFVTHVANLRHAVKNQEMLLKAAEKLNLDFPDAHFVFAGEGERKEELEKMTQDFGVSDRTHFIGRCSKVPELLSISSVCVLTSTAEGFSNSILEYMYFGKPVVSTNVGGVSEVIVNGETGFLIESNDVESLAEKLMYLLGNESNATKMGQAGKLRVEKNFSPDRQIRKTTELYNKLDER